MKKARVHLPITLDVDVAAFEGSNLELTAATLVGYLVSVLRSVESELRADGIDDFERNIAKVTFEWGGPTHLRRQFSEKQRRAIEKRLASAVDTAVAMTPPVPPPPPKEGYATKRIEFRGEFYGLMLLAEAVWPNVGDTWRTIYRDQFEDKVAAVAWVITIERAITWTHLYFQIRKLATDTFGDDLLFTYLWDSNRSADLRALDKKHLRGLPDLVDQEMTAVAPDSATKRDWTVPVGVTIIFVASGFPELVLTDYFVFASLTVKITFSEAQISLMAMLERLSSVFKFDDVIVPLMDLYGDLTLQLQVWPFKITKKPISREALRIHLVAEATAEYARAEQLGELVLLTPANEASYPTDILRHARGWAGDVVTPDPLYPGRDLQPGVRGVYFYPLIDDRSFAKQIGYARQWWGIQADAEGVIAVLGDHDDFWKWAVDARNVYDAERWDLFLLALDRKHKLDAFFDAWLEHNLYPVTFKPLIALSMRSRYARHPRLVNVIRKLETWQQGLLLHEYDEDVGPMRAGRIRLFGSNDTSDWIYAAGDSAVASDGVVAETTSYYSEGKKVKRLKKATLERLSEPVRKKVGDLMARLVCAGDETMTEEQIIAQATAEAMKDLGIDPNHDPDNYNFEPTEIRLSLRVIRVDRRRKGGVEEIYVQFHQVRKYSGGEWEKAGELEEVNALQFEAALRYYHLQHLMTALTIGVLIFAVVGTGVAIVVAGVATIAEVLIMVVISEAMYLWTNRKEGYTLTGFLLAAWIGELELIGFKGLGKALGLAGTGLRTLTGTALKLLGETAAKRVTGAVLRNAATRWIAFVLRAAVTGVEFGTLAAFHRFAEDLFHMTRCKGFSSPSEYWRDFKIGFAIGMAMELIAIPALAPLARKLADKGATMLEAAKVLSEDGKSYGEIARTLLGGAEEMERVLGRTLDKPAIIDPLAQGFREKIVSLLRTYAREYNSRAYKSLVQLIEGEMSAAASRGLSRVLGAAPEGQLDELIASLSRGKMPVNDVLELLSVLDKDAMAALVKSGNLARLAESPALLTYLKYDVTLGWRLVGEIYGYAIGDLEAYLSRLAKADPALVDNFARILLRRGNKLPRDLVEALVLSNRGVTRYQLPIIDKLYASNVDVAAFAEGKGPTIAEFEKAWNGMTPGEQAYSLGGGANQTPAAVLAEAQKTREILEKAARQMDPTGKDLAEQLSAGTRKQARSAIKAAFREGGAQEAKILISVLRKNAAEYARMRQALDAFNPDAIVGIERGGPFIADAATYGSTSLNNKIIRIAKSGSANAEYAAAKSEVETLIAAGKKRFVFTDVYFSGSARNKFLKDVIEPLASAHPECEFKGLWIREQLGFEQTVLGSGRPQLAVPKKLDLPNVQNIEYEVPFVLGDDAELLLSRSASDAKPVYLFDEAGRIVEALTPKPGETTRDLFLRILWTWKG